MLCDRRERERERAVRLTARGASDAPFSSTLCKQLERAIIDEGSEQLVGATVLADGHRGVFERRLVAEVRLDLGEALRHLVCLVGRIVLPQAVPLGAWPREPIDRTTVAQQHGVRCAITWACEPRACVLQVSRVVEAHVDDCARATNDIRRWFGTRACAQHQDNVHSPSCVAAACAA